MKRDLLIVKFDAQFVTPLHHSIIIHTYQRWDTGSSATAEGPRDALC